MDNWQKIIQGYAKPADSSTVKYIDATVTNVRDSEMHWADVKLITGQEVSNLPNKSSEKLYAGRNVMVGYRTVPSKGWIAMASGETDPLKSGGGGVEVETAALLDEDNAHHWLADQELMLYLDATTRLLYGGNQRLVSVQGHVCRTRESVTLDSSEFDMFGAEMKLDIWWRENSASAYEQLTMRYKTWVHQVQFLTNSGEPFTRYYFALSVRRCDGSLVLNEQIFYSQAIDISGYNEGVAVEVHIIPTASYMYFADTFSTTWNHITESVSTPYGYSLCSQLKIGCGVKIGDTVTVSRWRTSSGSVDVTACGTISNQQYHCVPYESLAEKCFDISLIQRSEPTTPNQGGGGNA